MQITLRELMAAMAVISVALALGGELALPGICGASLLTFVIVTASADRAAKVAWQIITLAYLCLLLELVWCACAEFRIGDHRFGNTYWNTMGPIFLRTIGAASVLLPGLIVAGVITTAWCGGCRGVIPKPIWIVLIVATVGVLVLSLGTHFVLWQGMGRGSYEDWGPIW